jgi:hypothetical protein
MYSSKEWMKVLIYIFIPARYQAKSKAQVLPPWLGGLKMQISHQFGKDVFGYGPDSSQGTSSNASSPSAKKETLQSISLIAKDGEKFASNSSESTQVIEKYFSSDSIL